MLAVEQPFPPADYSSLWTWLGVAALAAAVALVLWAYLPRRQRHPVDVAAEPEPAAPDLDAIKTKYLAVIDQLDARHRDGALSDRALHHELSMTLRRFVNEAGGPRAANMTPTDLRGVGLPQVAGTVEHYWEPQFSRRGAAVVGDAPPAERARQVVRQW